MSNGQPDSLAVLQNASDRAVKYFELAVSLYLWFWPALRTAVDREYGGPDSEDKRDLLTGAVADLFTSTQREQDVEDIEYILAEAMSDGFNLSLEDDSAFQVATHICDAWRDCQEGQFSRIEDLRTRFLALQQKREQQRPIQNADDSDSSGTDAELDKDPATNADADTMDVDTDMTTASNTREPVIDADGFELVHSKGKGKRRQ